ncbi:MAG: asparagine synthase (glutamine-hydrolyzing) [Phaeodactylibacter sp.]|uniref:asparagine synthase (glutamine-hydrolyzing) n=1 Tax=Phaeodactylibacter sp. TaxID=1940289 RepID=UPI0032EFC1FA
MCGIIGQISLRQPIHPQRFNTMRDTLAHRGPDGYGSWFAKDHSAALGHRRLSFLDLSEQGQQPMPNETEDIWLTFNGEIYNYLPLRAKLEQAGHQFRSRTDSEVLLHAYEEWGADMLHRLKGMFAFGIWDDRKKRLFLARDRFGIKPLYYGYFDHQFYFASELKAIIKGLPGCPPPSMSAVADFLVYRYVPSPKTIWEGLKKLPPAHYLDIPFEAAPPSLDPKCYWQLPDARLSIDTRDAIQSTHTLLNQSIEAHLQSDVPVGSFLSGGYDSSALAAYASAQGYPLQTFSIGFEGWANSEHQHARQVAQHLKLPLHTRMAGHEQLALMDKLAYHYDEPLGDISTIPTYMVSALASRHCKAVLSGEGADELFIGYGWQQPIAQLNTRHRLQLYFRERLFGKSMTAYYASAMAMGRFDLTTLKQVLHPRLHKELPAFPEWFYKAQVHPKTQLIKTVQQLDIKTFMGELVLTKIDRASMACGLEVRVPFLDHELVSFLYQLPADVVFNKQQTKFLLYECIKSQLPASILKRPKQGFVGPDRYYMSYAFYAEALRNGRLVKEAVISREAVEALLQAKDHWRLWKLTVLEKWWQTWIN